MMKGWGASPSLALGGESDGLGQVMVSHPSSECLLAVVKQSRFVCAHMLQFMYGLVMGI